MADSPTNVIYLTQDQLAKWLIEDAPYKIQIARVWPFMGIQGGKITYTRTAALESVANIDTMATILGDGSTDIEDQTAPVSDPNAALPNTSVFTLGELATRYKIDYVAMDRFKYPNNIDSVEAALAIRRLLYMYFRKLDLDQGAGTQAGNFRSLYELSNNNTAATNTNALTKLDSLQDAYHKITANNGRPNAIMCNSRAMRWIIQAYYGAGTLPEMVETEWQDPLKGTLRAPQVAINGTPVYINDMIATAAGTPDTTKIYFMVLGDACEAGPVRGITGIVPGPLKSTMFIRREAAEPSAGETSRINVTYGFPVATAVGSSGALSVLTGVDVESIT